MIEIDSPLIRELLQELIPPLKQKHILIVLKARFGKLPRSLSTRLKVIAKVEELNDLIKFAARCPNIAAFEARLPEEWPRSASSRKKPRRRKPSADQ